MPDFSLPQNLPQNFPALRFTPEFTPEFFGSEIYPRIYPRIFQISYPRNYRIYPRIKKVWSDLSILGINSPPASVFFTFREFLDWDFLGIDGFFSKSGTAHGLASVHVALPLLLQ